MPVLVRSFRVRMGRAKIHRSTAICDRKTTLTKKMLPVGDYHYRQSAACSSACHWDLCSGPPPLTALSVSLSAATQTWSWGYIRTCALAVAPSNNLKEVLAMAAANMAAVEEDLAPPSAMAS